MGKMSGVSGGGPDNQTQNNNFQLTTIPKTIIFNSQNNRKSNENTTICAENGHQIYKNTQFVRKIKKIITQIPEIDPKQ